MVDCDCRSRSVTFAQKFGSRQCSKSVPIGSVITWWRVAYSASWICEAASGRIGRGGGLAAAGAPGSGAGGGEALAAVGAGEVLAQRAGLGRIGTLIRPFFVAGWDAVGQFPHD
jgi:hypothetical protein